MSPRRFISLYNDGLSFAPWSLNVDYCLQKQLLDAKKQLEVQCALHQRTREQLNAAQQELHSLQQQQLNTREGGVSSPSKHTGLTGNIHCPQFINHTPYSTCCTAL